MPIVTCGNQTWFVRKSWNITSFIDDFPIKSFAVVVGKFPLLCLTECTLDFFGGLTVNFINFISNKMKPTNPNAHTYVEGNDVKVSIVNKRLKC